MREDKPFRHPLAEEARKELMARDEYSGIKHNGREEAYSHYSDVELIQELIERDNSGYDYK